MPGSIRSIRTLDAAYQRLNTPEERTSLQTDKTILLPQKGMKTLRNPISPVQLPPSPADSEPAGMQAPADPMEPTEEEQRLTRPIERGTPGEGVISPEKKTPEQRELAKRKSAYYGDAFATREPNGSARERMTRESMIMADVRTNVIIQDEYTFITDLSYALSGRYQRPESSIILTVVHSACLLYAGNFDPAYTLTITALPSQLQPVTNKRNAALLAKSMEEGLGVGPERGLIRFVPIAEENLATGGQTLAGAIEDSERQHSEDNANLKGSLSTSRSTKRQSMRSLRSRRGGQLPTHEERATPVPTPTPNDRTVEAPPIPAIPTVPSKMDLRAEKAQKMSRRRSFMAAVFGK